MNKRGEVRTMKKMQHGIMWSDSYKLGAEEVDAQHKKLFELLSELVASCMDGSDVEKVSKTLDFLVNYTIQHFIAEEALQVNSGYPDYFKHKTIHEDFKVTVDRLVEEFNKSGSSAELSKNINKIVIKWLIEHIQIEDKKIGVHIREIGYRA